MAAQHGAAPEEHASSAGQGYTAGAWLDMHFEVARPEYEAQLRAVGFQPGWRVLDAACGSGSFLPVMAQLVGAGGSLAALDLAPDNVALVEQRVAAWALPCPVETRVGDVLALPYPDGAFDAAWFANTTQYFGDEDLAAVLAGLRRVVRPGGLVAIQEGDGALQRVLPAPPGILLRLYQAAASAGYVPVAGVLRSAMLPAWLRRAGPVDVWRRSALIERTAPLAPLARQFWGDILRALAALAPTLDLPAADQAFWAPLRDPSALDRYLDDPDFCGCDARLLAVGTVPDAGV